MADLAGAAHWDAAYAHGDGTRSWFQQQPGMSLHCWTPPGSQPLML
ncbi:MAG: hypothetical protein M3Z75_13860 [Actinomycetota bacterium]|nr:hypothetical protein [Actinomycetota bacterium]